MSQVKIGDTVEEKRAFSEDDVIAFSRICGDTNPIHLDETYAQTTRFRKRIVHGLLTASTISALIGTKLPGPGAIYLRQSLEFKAPVFIGEEVVCRVTVKSAKGRLLHLETRCTKTDGTIALDGAADVLTSR